MAKRKSTSDGIDIQHVLEQAEGSCRTFQTVAVKYREDGTRVPDNGVPTLVAEIHHNRTNQLLSTGSGPTNDLAIEAAISNLVKITGITVAPVSREAQLQIEVDTLKAQMNTLLTALHTSRDPVLSVPAEPAPEPERRGKVKTPSNP